MPDKCTRTPGCPGDIIEEYCNECGKKAVLSGAGAGGPATGSDPEWDAGTASRSSTRSGSDLGAGLTYVPPMPVPELEEAVVEDPHVPEHRRHCPNGHPVGRRRPDGRPGRVQGYCEKDGLPYSFVPGLQPGMRIAGQYLVKGVRGHGGLGWVYLARDLKVNNRPVAIKGLINARDADADSIVNTEMRYLADLEHPRIVDIYNFVTHDDEPYIVMAYVGGKSLKEIIEDRYKANDGKPDPLPLDQALAYIIGVLPAIQYLHDRDQLYCDFKPENLIHSGEEIKLVDMGAVFPQDVKGLDPADLPQLFGTPGFQAPELTSERSSARPTVASDLYTIGRTLAVLTMHFEFRSTHISDIPSASTTLGAQTGTDRPHVPLLERYDSFRRLLARACAERPEDRFCSAEEMRTQLLGLLNEVMADRAAKAGVPRPQTVPSQLFSPLAVEDPSLSTRQLPSLRIDPSDPMAAWLASVAAPDAAARAAALAAAPEATVAVRAAEAEAALTAGDRPRTRGLIDSLDRTAADEDGGPEPATPRERRIKAHQQSGARVRAAWLTGILCLVENDLTGAREAFADVYDQVPGELAPKLALALTCEGVGDDLSAEYFYLLCARTDPAYTTAGAFGIARVRAHHKNRNYVGAARALEMVARVDRSYVEARRRRAELLTKGATDVASLAPVLGSVAEVSIDPRALAQLRVDVFEAALARDRDPNVSIEGVPAEDRPLRLAYEQALRDLARRTPDPARQEKLVDRANDWRPWTAT